MTILYLEDSLTIICQKQYQYSFIAVNFDRYFKTGGVLAAGAVTQTALDRRQIKYAVQKAIWNAYKAEMIQL